MRRAAGRLPLRPLAGSRLVAAEVARVPLRHPQAALRVRPHAPRALAARRRLDHRRGAARRVDARDVRAGERGVVQHALRGHVDAVRAAALRRVEYFHLAAARIEAAVDAALAGKPVHAVLVEDRGVEIGVAAAFGQRLHQSHHRDLRPARRALVYRPERHLRPPRSAQRPAYTIRTTGWTPPVRVTTDHTRRPGPDA